MKRYAAIFSLVVFGSTAFAKQPPTPVANQVAAPMKKAGPPRALASVTGVRELSCKFDLSSHDNKTIYNTLTFPLIAENALQPAGLEGMLGPFKVQVLYHASPYLVSSKPVNLLDKLTLTIWEAGDDQSPVGITGAGEADVPLDLATVGRTRHMVKLTKTTKIVYYCFAPTK